MIEGSTLQTCVVETDFAARMYLFLALLVAQALPPASPLEMNLISRGGGVALLLKVSFVIVFLHGWKTKHLNMGLFVDLPKKGSEFKVTELEINEDTYLIQMMPI
ncbi:transmembrane protein, putative [Medicago truncatula]|uniref:Transmembrane protein, putative n=1 Tax=Medicago truncatula TaxID=3880 RepID=A0A072UMG6_MEDTR|nr:transmembrane protein, putative [Medicago truncatula]